jgi:hypothetical protein
MSPQKNMKRVFTDPENLDETNHCPPERDKVMKKASTE